MPGRPLILDANSLAYRCLMATALDDLKTGQRPTGGVYGAIRMLAALIEKIRDVTFITACWDDGVPEYRKRLHPGYKQKRKESRSKWTDEEKERVFSQVPLIQEAFTALGVRNVSFSNREADDTVAAMCRLYSSECNEAPMVVSGDKDLFQLLNVAGVGIWYLGKDAKVGMAEIEEEYGVTPQTWLVYKTLIGDASDGIPGVKGCGPKTASAWIAEASAAHDKGRPGRWYDLQTPAVQLEAMRDLFRDRSEARKVEEVFLNGYPELCNMLKVVDLAMAPIPQELLAPVLYDNVAVDRKRFKTLCHDLAFQSIIGSMDKYLQTFLHAQHRRNTQLEHTFGDPITGARKKHRKK